MKTFVMLCFLTVSALLSGCYIATAPLQTQVVLTPRHVHYPPSITYRENPQPNIRRPRMHCWQERDYYGRLYTVCR